MSVVIVGGNDCMERLYVETCKGFGCKAKVFTQMKGEMKRQIGKPDLVILFTNTVSHKMVTCAVGAAKSCNAAVERSHSSSLHALQTILQVRCREARKMV